MGGPWTIESVMQGKERGGWMRCRFLGWMEEWTVEIGFLWGGAGGRTVGWGTCTRLDLESSKEGGDGEGVTHQLLH